MQAFKKFLTQVYARLKEIQENPYADPAVDSVAVDMLVEDANARARKVGCGHLVVRKEDAGSYPTPASWGMSSVQTMLDWCQEQGTKA